MDLDDYVWVLDEVTSQARSALGLMQFHEHKILFFIWDFCCLKIYVSYLIRTNFRELGILISTLCKRKNHAKMPAWFSQSHSSSKGWHQDMIQIVQTLDSSSIIRTLSKWEFGDTGIQCCMWCVPLKCTCVCVCVHSYSKHCITTLNIRWSSFLRKYQRVDSHLLFTLVSIEISWEQNQLYSLVCVLNFNSVLHRRVGITLTCGFFVLLFSDCRQ